MSDDRYYTRLAAAFVRGKLGAQAGLSDAQLIEFGIAAGLRIHKFKQNAELPRVRKVLGMLQGLAPASLIDIGSGRGTFLWPLVDLFPTLPIVAVDQHARRVIDIDAVRRGGVDTLSAVLMDGAQLGFADASADVVTMLEVMEHLPAPAAAAREALRVARRCAIFSVPSKEDDNPEHIHLFDRESLTALITRAGAQRVRVEYLLNHIIAIAHR